MKAEELRDAICEVGRLMYQFQYVGATAGNISARLNDDHILATPSGLAKGFMTPEQLIVVNMAGEKVAPITEANRHLRPTSEISMHLEVYKQRSDLQAVVHAHPPTAVALTLVGIPIQQWNIPEAIVLLGPIPTTPYATPSSTENRDAISEVIKDHNVLMLSNHGSLTAGHDVWEAYHHLESLEQTAKITHLAHQLGGGNPLPPDQLEKLREQRRAMGLHQPGEVWEHLD